MNEIYIVKKYEPTEKVVSWEDVLLNFEMKDLFYQRKNTTNQTVTRKIELRAATAEERDFVYHAVRFLNSFVRRYANLYEHDRRSLYRSYKIPKRNGGLRPIDEPREDLMRALTELRDEIDSWGQFHHASAYAYITKRCTVDELKVHQRFESEYFLKTDLTNFFGSTTEEFVYRQMSMIAPFCFIVNSDPFIDIDPPHDIIYPASLLKKAISLAFLNGGLPQGSPISPFLTNLIMIPIDYALASKFSKMKLVYTRYADDMLISGREKFPWRKMVDVIHETFAEFNAPYRMNDEKTKFVSRKGSNFNLGLIINGNNDITIGYKNKKIFKAMVNNFILDTKNGKPWPVEDVAHMNGLLSYYMNVEKEYFTDLIDRYNKKYNCNFKNMVHKYLYE